MATESVRNGMDPLLRDELAEILRENIPESVPHSGLPPEQLKALAIELAAAMPPAPTSDDVELRRRAEDAFVRLDAAIPSVMLAIEALGNTDEALQLACARYALDGAHAALRPIWNGEV